MAPIRILHIVNTLDRGGMESRIMDIYRRLDRSKFQYDFYVESGCKGVFEDEVEALEGRVFRPEKSKRYNIPDFRDFRLFLSDHPEFDVIYAYNQWAGFYLKEACKCNVPFRIASSRTSIQTKSLKNTLKNVVKLNTNKYATHRFAVSQKAANWLFGEKDDQMKKIEIWPNAIDTQKYAFSFETREEVRRELELDNSFVVIHVGNIRFEKNHSFLLKVFSEIIKRDKNAKLVLIGGGDKEVLKTLIEDLSLENRVIILGVRGDVPRLLQAGDVFVFPSFYEGFPGAVLEAEASGLNCLISDTITKEVMLTKHIKAMSLQAKASLWADAVVEMKNADRVHAWEEIRDAGYDIIDLAKRTEKFYESLKV